MGESEPAQAGAPKTGDEPESTWTIDRIGAIIGLLALVTGASSVTEIFNTLSGRKASEAATQALAQQQDIIAADTALVLQQRVDIRASRRRRRISARV